MQRSFLHLVLSLMLLSLTLFSCRKDTDSSPSGAKGTASYSDEVASQWMNFYLEIERFTPGYRPPVSARTLGYIGLGAYEAVQPGMADQYNSMANRYFGLQLPAIDESVQYHWPTCLNAAYGVLFTRFFQTAPAAQLQQLFSLKQQFADQFSNEISQDVYNRSVAYGESVGNAVYEWSKTDAAGHEGYLHTNDPAYIPPAGPGRWQPTYPDYSKALLPHWGDARTFVADQDDAVDAPLAYSEDPGSTQHAQAQEVVAIVNQIKSGQSYQNKWIADFWSDDCPALTFTPAGRWIAVSNQILQQKNATLDLAVYTYAKVGMALCDAGIRCWHEKYRYNVLRPVDYIRTVMGQPDWNTLMCPDGSGNYYTPPFPAYPSGHATFGAAAAEVLTDIFGYNYPMVDECHKDRTEFIGTPRSFDNFYQMAQENAFSRIPIGVHFRMDAESGLDLGFRIGRKVNDLPWKK